MSKWADVRERAAELRRDAEFDNHRRDRLSPISTFNDEIFEILVYGDREDVRDAYHAVFGTP